MDNQGSRSKSFLNLWTYPNLYRKAGKELADLIVVFGNDVLIFSDKSIGYQNGSDPLLNWSRWFRAAIRESAEQIWKAEHCVLRHPTQIYLDSKATQPLPLQLPSAADIRFHGICVVSGASKRCAELTSCPSLSMDLDVVDAGKPFTVGRISNQRRWVHVFDEITISPLLKALSTTKDFVTYLSAKEGMLDGGLFKAADCELDVLGYYLWHNREFPPQSQPFRLDHNIWNTVCTNPQFQSGMRKNRVSALWDHLIEYLTKHYLDETLEFGNDLAVSEWEVLVRFMASETRFYRRVLSEQILNRLRSVRAREQHKIGTLLPSEDPLVQYVILIGPGSTEEDHIAFREDRRKELQMRCVAAKAVKPDSRFFIGIALDGKEGGGGSEDFLFMDTAGWDEQRLTHAKKVQAELGYFMPGKMRETLTSEDEYPDA